MNQLNFSDNEIRVLGCLIEKEVTTPDLYPLSLNALQNACNQKSNREPITNYSTSELQTIIDELIDKTLITDISTFNSRVAKYQHRFCNTEFSDLQFDAKELAILCLLFLRGPQTAGEIKSRSNRLCHFESLDDVEFTLESLNQQPGGPFIFPLAKEAGKRERRYMHAFGNNVSDDITTPFVTSSHLPPTQNKDAITELSARVDSLEAQVATLTNQLQTLINVN